MKLADLEIIRFDRIEKCKYSIIFFLALLALLLAGGCAGTDIKGPVFKCNPLAGQSAARSVGELLCREENTGDDKVRSLLSTAFTQMGKPYRYGGASPKTGFDCSGFTQWVYAQHGTSLPRTPRDQIKMGIPVDPASLQPGDLVFYQDRWLHVGIYTGNGKFIHSPHTGDRIKESKALDRYHKTHFAGARRVLDYENAKELPEDLKKKIVGQALASNAPMEKKDKPKPEHATVADTATIKTPKPQTTPSKYYKIKKGDTIWHVARKVRGYPAKPAAGQQDERQSNA